MKRRAGLAVTLCLLVLGGCRGSGGSGKAATSTPVTSVPADTTTGTTLPGTTAAGSEQSVAATTSTTVTRSSTTTQQVAPSGGCVNSTDPKCGPFSWNPQPPPNQPVTLTVTAEPASARVGQDVVFTVTFADPDAGQPTGCDTQSQMYGDGSPNHQRICDDASSCTWTGPHTPPLPVSGRWTMSYHHVYSRAGKFVATFTGTSRTPGAQAHCADTHTGRPGDPYASAGTADITVTVS
jgi:hypothetical protein